MRQTIILILLGLSVGLNIALVAAWVLHTPKMRQAGYFSRQTDHGTTPNNKERVWCDLHRRLDVSEEQWKKLEPVMRQFHDNVRSHRKRIRELRAEMFSILRKDEADRDKIQKMQSRMREVQGKVQDLVLEHILQEKEVLTDKQEEQFLQLLGERIRCRRRDGWMKRKRHRRFGEEHRGMR